MGQAVEACNNYRDAAAVEGERALRFQRTGVSPGRDF